jgi:hypothetical protein
VPRPSALHRKRCASHRIASRASEHKLLCRPTDPALFDSIRFGRHTLSTMSTEMNVAVTCGAQSKLSAGRCSGRHGHGSRVWATIVVPTCSRPLLQPGPTYAASRLTHGHLGL